jgi:Reverse transcriptase (RNA-dependent DNA polymerase)
MNSVFRDLPDVYGICYLDDILVYSMSEANHQEHVTEVLRRLLKEKLFCKRSKCHFNRKQVKFLGHVVSSEGVAMQSDEVAAVMDWPTPSTNVELQAFLGLSKYYRRFILNFSAVLAPLTDGTKIRRRSTGETTKTGPSLPSRQPSPRPRYSGYRTRASPLQSPPMPVT